MGSKKQHHCLLAEDKFGKCGRIEYMPNYVYVCPQGHRFEELKRIEDRFEAVCPQCGQLCEQFVPASFCFNNVSLLQKAATERLRGEGSQHIEIR